MYSRNTVPSFTKTPENLGAIHSNDTISSPEPRIKRNNTFDFFTPTSIQKQEEKNPLLIKLIL